jgi:hypothetical protein
MVMQPSWLQGMKDVVGHAAGRDVDAHVAWAGEGFHLAFGKIIDP